MAALLFHSAKKLMAVCVIIASISACSMISFELSPKTRQVEQLLSNEEFYPALDLIDRASPNDSNYEQLSAMRKDVLLAIERFEQREIESANSLIKQSEWGKAAAVIDDALLRVPASKSLIKTRKRIQRVVDMQIEKIHLSLAELRAGTLAEEISLMSESQRFLPSQQTSDALAQRQTERELSSDILAQQARRMINKERWQEALHYATLAHQLSKTDQSKKLLHSVKAEIYAAKLNRFQQALANNELLVAKQLASELSADGSRAEVKALTESLEQKIQIAILQLTRDGQHAYSKGSIDQAIEYWQQAVVLDPENDELKKRLQRAVAFKSNYQRFKQN